MVSPKVTKPAARNVAPRHRGHSLAPEHLGEVGAGATLTVAIGGTAIFIAALAMIVGGLTLPGRYGGATPPPNVGQLGVGQVIGGIGLLVLGVLIVASAMALFADLPRSRPLASVICALTALLAAAGLALLLANTRRDLVLITAIAVVLVAFAGAAFVLARLRR